MKKLLLVVAMIAAGFTANAQTFGVKGGLNVANVDVDTDFGGGSPDGKTSFYLGGLVDFEISEKFHIQPEVLYSGDGFDGFDMSFLTVPVMAKYYVAEGFNIQAGPQLGFLVDSDGDTDEMESFNFSLGLGAAYELESGLFFDMRYNIGLSNLSQDPSVDVSTKAFQVGLGYRF
ncbi:porin family protein [Tenacibaculum crassostreae]|uniref:porin family protein n=1 Tax=Tenacibaculum crassostreae TaxID=502683 RepID=UPI003894C1CD